MVILLSALSKIRHKNAQKGCKLEVRGMAYNLFAQFCALSSKGLIIDAAERQRIQRFCFLQKEVSHAFSGAEEPALAWEYALRLSA
jgi:hypothetical protein